MPCDVSGYSTILDSALADVEWTAQKYVYAVPSRVDFLVSDGGAWKAWQGDPDLAGTGYAGGVKVAVNKSTGAWTVSLPFSDTEVLLGGSSPALKWNIIDPNPATGTQYYYGETIAGTVSTSKTLYQLLSACGWQIGSTTYHAVPAGERRKVAVEWTSSLDEELDATWADIGTDAWKCSIGVRTDDTGTFAVNLVETSQTPTGATFRISQKPASGKKVIADIEVYV